ncbi:MAG: putative LPS assembly protein LptD [bacterium]|nr:putative LPS assembly protein LptD [bacterium]
MRTSLMQGSVTLLLLISLCSATNAHGEGDAMGEADAELALTRMLLDAPAGREGGFEYRADSFVDFVEGDSILLLGHAVVLHRGARLEAAEMVYHRNLRVVVARAASDSTGSPVGIPTLSRGADVLTGERILYDTDSGEGVIRDGRIGHEDGFYTGQQIQTRSEAEFLVHAGSYTTCDAQHPHFDFYSPRIKVLVGDMAIARPVYFRIAEHRLIYVPFYVFSLREDRQSGILTPGYGRRAVSFGSNISEWEVRDLGYYFAPSDYWDATLSTDLRQRTGWLTRAALNYAWRYRYSGRLETRIQSSEVGDRTSWSWWLSGNHSQELSPSSSLRASGTFQSSRDFIRDNGAGLDERLNRTLRSSIRFDKRWREAGWSLSAGASQTKNLDTERADVVLPELSVHLSRKSLFPTKTGSGSASAAGPWYSRIYYDGSARTRNTRQTTSTATTDRTSADASLRLSSQGRPADWLNVNSSFNSSWQHTNLRDGGIEGVRTDQANVSATLSQTVYGQFYPHIWRLTAVRHVLKPDAGLSFSVTRPDTGDVAGFGGPGGDWRASRRLTFRLANTFWAKLRSTDGEGEESKHRLAQLNLSTSYDLDKEQRPLADLITSLTIDAARNLNTRLSLRSEFYDDQDHRLRTPRINRFEINSSLRFVGTTSRTEDRSTAQSGEDNVDTDQAQGGDFGYENGLQQDINRGGGRRLQLSHYYSRQSSLGRKVTRSWLRSSVGGSLLRVWHVDYSGSLNLHAPGIAAFDRDRITAELLSVQREFHDWTATFNIEPTRFGSDRAFYFKAQLKDIPQIRFERGDSRRVG